MRWPFTLFRSVSLRTTINAPTDTVLGIVHSPHQLFSLSPLVLDFSLNPLDGPSSYVVTERLSFLGFETKTSFRCTLIPREDGIDTEVIADAGTRINSVYRVKAGDDGTTIFTEQATIKGLFFLMPYIVHTMSQAHIAIFSNLTKKAEMVSNRPVREPEAIEYTKSGPSTSPGIFFALATPLFIFTIRTLWPSTAHISTPILIIGVLSIIYRLDMTTDPYGLFHLGLNILPGTDPSTPPQTEWLNMGFWRDTQVFPHACAALATKLIQAVQYKSGDRILDVGHGTGESLLLLLSDPSIRPSSLTGITSLATHHRRSQDRVARLQASLEGPQTEVSLHACDAVYHLGDLNHPLDPSTPQIFDIIFALDCAYHFNTRKFFLHQSFNKLAPGGRIALADICFEPTSSWAWLMTSLLRIIPKQNLVSTNGYISDMASINFVDIQLQDITEHVFPGFIRFLKGRGWGWWMFGSVMQWYASAGAKFVIITGSKRVE